VLRVGQLEAGDKLILQDRPNPDFPFTRLVEIIYHGKASTDEIRRMAELEGLASQWRSRAKEMLREMPG
jgi:MOSC domain-containing protein YiiM